MAQSKKAKMQIGEYITFVDISEWKGGEVTVKDIGFAIIPFRYFDWYNLQFIREQYRKLKTFFK